MITLLDLLEGESVIFLLVRVNKTFAPGKEDQEVSFPEKQAEMGFLTLCGSQKDLRGAATHNWAILTVINHCLIFPGFDYNASRSYL